MFYWLRVLLGKEKLRVKIPPKVFFPDKKIERETRLGLRPYIVTSDVYKKVEGKSNKRIMFDEEEYKDV